MGCDYSKQTQEDFKYKISDLNQRINYLQTQYAALMSELNSLKHKSQEIIPIEDIQNELGNQIKSIEDMLNSIQKQPISRPTIGFNRTEEYDFTPDPSAIQVESASKSSYDSSSSSESEPLSPSTVEALHSDKGVIMEDPYIKAMVEFKRKQLQTKSAITSSTRDTKIMKV